MNPTLAQLQADGWVEVSPGQFKRSPKGPIISPSDQGGVVTPPKRSYVKNASSVGGLVSPESQSDPLPALDQKSAHRRGKPYRVALVITLIRVSKSVLDGDNLVASFKGLRDAIAKSLGVDDEDHRLRWEFRQIQSRAERGTIVRINRV